MSAIAVDEQQLLRAPEVGPEVPSFVESTRPRLHTVAPVKAPRKRPLRYAIAAIIGITIIAAAQVSIALITTQESFVLADREQAHRALTWEQQALESDVIALGSPQQLAQQASQQGLVVNGSPHYLRLSDGAVIGSTDPAAPWSVVTPQNASIANALIDTPATLRDQAAWDAVFAAGVKPASAATLSTPQIRRPAPVAATEPEEQQADAPVEPVAETESAANEEHLAQDAEPVDEAVTEHEEIANEELAAGE